MSLPACANRALTRTHQATQRLQAIPIVAPLRSSYLFDLVGCPAQPSSTTSKQGTWVELQAAVYAAINLAANIQAQATSCSIVDVAATTGMIQTNSTIMWTRSADGGLLLDGAVGTPAGTNCWTSLTASGIQLRRCNTDMYGQVCKLGTDFCWRRGRTTSNLSMRMRPSCMSVACARCHCCQGFAYFA